MNNLNESLPDLMRRATETLEPESTDLVERGMSRGATLRRRRTALLSFTGAGAVLATAGIIIGSTQLLGNSSAGGLPVAGTPAAATPIPSAKTVTPAQTLDTLLRLVPGNLTKSSPQSSGDNGLHRASVVVNDGKGASLLTVALMSSIPIKGCAGLHGNCTVQPDGSVVTSYANESIFPYEPAKNPGGVKNTVLEIFRPDGSVISLYSYNAPKEIDVQHTRANPLFSVKNLTQLATSDLWVYPSKHEGQAKPDPKHPGTGKPTVPVAQTLQTLKQVLPSELQFSRPQTWGGGTEGHNGAAYVVNDGKGLSRVDVLVTYETPVTKCLGEGPQHCEVKPDGSVIGWSEEVPVYSDERQAINAVIYNQVEIHYPDGRSISMDSFNATQEKDAKHTRVKPALTTDQLLSMARDKAWKFPGTGTK